MNEKMKNPAQIEKKQEEILKKVPTFMLVRELKSRESVETTIAEPYEECSISINGPAVVLVVID